MSAGPPWEDPRRVLARHGLTPSRRFSQNFLVSRSVVETIAEAVGEESPVVEIGPGVGTLTAALLRRGVAVVAIERDRKMVALLREELSSYALEVREGDAAALDLEALGLQTPTPLCGNLPYSLTGAILRRIVGARPSLTRAVVMVQREVRDRLLADPGTKAYGALSVFVQAGFSIRPVVEVRPGSFYPAPRVASSVVCLTPLAKPRAIEDDAFRSVVKAAFAQRRKTLGNALGALGPEAREALGAVAIDPRRRGETLSVEELARVAEAYSSLRK